MLSSKRFNNYNMKDSPSSNNTSRSESYDKHMNEDKHKS